MTDGTEGMKAFKGIHPDLVLIEPSRVAAIGGNIACECPERASRYSVARSRQPPVEAAGTPELSRFFGIVIMMYYNPTLPLTSTRVTEVGRPESRLIRCACWQDVCRPEPWDS